MESEIIAAPQTDETQATPAEVAENIEKQQVAEVVSEVEQAARRFTGLLPYVKKIANAAEGKKSLVRVLHALAEFPLGASVPRLLNDNERQLFQVMSELSAAKTVLLNSFMKQQQPPAPDEAGATSKEGSTNE